MTSTTTGLASSSQLSACPSASRRRLAVHTSSMTYQIVVMATAPLPWQQLLGQYIRHSSGYRCWQSSVRCAEIWTGRTDEQVRSWSDAEHRRHSRGIDALSTVSRLFCLDMILYVVCLCVLLIYVNVVFVKLTLANKRNPLTYLFT